MNPTPRAYCERFLTGGLHPDVQAGPAHGRSQLQEAVVSHAVVDQAIGVVVTLGGDQDFQVLREVSQHTNVKLRQVSEQIVNRVHSEQLSDGEDEPGTTAHTLARTDPRESAVAGEWLLLGHVLPALPRGRHPSRRQAVESFGSRCQKVGALSSRLLIGFGPERGNRVRDAGLWSLHGLTPTAAVPKLVGGAGGRDHGREW